MIVKRKSRTGGNDIQTAYRPCRLDEFFGNETNKNIIRGNLDSNKVPHSYLFTGPAGCGKTTAARVIALGLNCEDFTDDVWVKIIKNTKYNDDVRNFSDGLRKVDFKNNKVLNKTLNIDMTVQHENYRKLKAYQRKATSEPCLKCISCKSILNHNSMDVMEINVGAYGNKDDVLKIIEDLPTAPFMARYKVLIMDEAHKLTSASQDVLLKIIEDSYSHVYFIFCTNEPQKLKGAFIDRCNVMNFGRLSIDTVYRLLQDVCDGEGIDRSGKSEILKYLAEESSGVSRKVLVWLKQVNDEGSWTLAAAKEVTGLLLDEEDPQIMELSRTLIKGQWKKSLGLYKKLEKLPAETVRIAVAGFFVGCLKRAETFPDGRKYSKILDIITVPIYEAGKLGQHKFYNYMFKTVDLINSSKK